MGTIGRTARAFLKLLTKGLFRLFLWDVITERSAWPIFFWAGTVLIIGTVAFSWLEGWSYVDAFYFSVVTLATVGYGDYTPKTVVGKLLTVFFILNGLGVLLALLNTITEIRRRKYRQTQERLQEQPKSRRRLSKLP